MSVRERGAAVLLLVVASCVTPAQTLPAGLYLAASGDEHVAIEGSEIRFRTRFAAAAGEEQGRLVTRSYRYSVEADGRIVPYVMTSAEAAFGVGRYEWLWSDGHILQRNRHTGETRAFRPTPEPQSPRHSP